MNFEIEAALWGLTILAMSTYVYVAYAIRRLVKDKTAGTHQDTEPATLTVGKALGTSITVTAPTAADVSTIYDDAMTTIENTKDEEVERAHLERWLKAHPEYVPDGIELPVPAVPFDDGLLADPLEKK